MSCLKTFLKAWCPPVLRDRMIPHIRFSGDFPDWRSARAATDGYESGVILRRAVAATAEVMAGRAAYERDTFLFTEPELNFPFLAALSMARPKTLLDVGGGLGSMFFQHRRFLKAVVYLVAEQPSFAAAGRALNVPGLEFFADWKTAMAKRPQLAVLSSVLGYLENPGKLLEDLAAGGVEYIFIDRTLFGGRARIAAEYTPRQLGGASYPVRVFEEDRLFARLKERYRMIFDFTALEGEVRLEKPSAAAVSRGFLWKKVGDV